MLSVHAAIRSCPNPKTPSRHSCVPNCLTSTSDHEKLMLLFLNHYHQEDNLRERLYSHNLNDILDEQIINANPLRESSEEKC